MSPVRSGEQARRAAAPKAPRVTRIEREAWWARLTPERQLVVLDHYEEMLRKYPDVDVLGHLRSAFALASVVSTPPCFCRRLCPRCQRKGGW